MTDSWSVWHEAKQLLRMHWRVIVSVMILGGLVGAGFALRNPVNYTARAELVTGNYSLPEEVAVQPAIDKAGALGLELPAETQARIVASPKIVDVAADALHLDEAGRIGLLSNVKASATTDNSLSISVKGATPEAAAASVNAVATAYLQYRADIGRAEMNALAQRAHTAATDSLDSAAALDEPLRTAQASNAGYAASILAKREELERAARAAESIAAALDVAVQSFNGGGALVRPGTPEDVDESLSPPMFVILGLVVGLLAGLAFTVIRRQISDRIMDRRDISRATGLAEIFELDGKRDIAAVGQLLLRSVAQSSSQLGVPYEQVAVRPLTPSRFGAAGLLALAAGGQGDLKSVAVVALPEDTGAEMSRLMGNRTSAPLNALTGQDLASVNNEIGCTAAAAFGTTPAPGGTYDLLLLATGPHFDAAGRHNTLPAGFSGPTVLVVHRKRDRVQDLEQALDELNAANLPVVAILFAEAEKGSTGKRHLGSLAGVERSWKTTAMARIDRLRGTPARRWGWAENQRATTGSQP